MPLTLASRKPLRILATVWAAVLVVGAAFTAVRGFDPFAGSPLVIRLLGSVAILGVVSAWVTNAVRLHTVLRLDAQGVGVHRVYPPLDRTYAWTELREWRRATGGRGAATLRLTFQDGRRVTIYPGAYRDADELQRQLEALLPGEGHRVRVGRTIRSTEGSRSPRPSV